jgi:hypothetical protein
VLLNLIPIGKKYEMPREGKTSQSSTQQTTHLQRPYPLIKLFNPIPMEINLRGHIFVRLVVSTAELNSAVIS